MVYTEKPKASSRYSPTYKKQIDLDLCVKSTKGDLVWYSMPQSIYTIDATISSYQEGFPEYTHEKIILEKDLYGF